MIQNKETMIQNKKTAIIGGGPGGLTLARLLQQQGADVTVYERDINRHTRLQGGALDLHEESGLAALAKAGLLDAFKKNFRPGADKMRIADETATLFYDEHAEEESPKDFGDAYFRPEIDRGPLRDILLDSLQPDTVVWDSHIVSLEPQGEGWNIIFRDGTKAYADLVIGADGANSKIRPYVTSLQPVWSGVTMVEGSVYDAAHTPAISALLKGGKLFVFGNGQTLIVSSKGDGGLGFYTGCRTEEAWLRDCGIDFTDHKQVLAWFTETFPGWGHVWQELFAHEKTLFIPRPQYHMPLDQSWDAQANITLIGDAAHCMPPYAGEGVNMAMLDALQLSECLADPAFSDTRSAIDAYQKLMFARFAEVGQLTLDNTRWMHEPEALSNMLKMFEIQ